jgi:hypothetical protein
VFGIDIDGTLGDYHYHFLRFAAGWLGRTGWPGPTKSRDEPVVGGWSNTSYYGECSLAEYMGISKVTYRKIKLAYRQGGLKRSMPVFEGAANLTRALRAAGGEVWVCTTRPFLQYDVVEPDTREWLRRNGIQYDGVLSGEHKYRDLVKTVGSLRVVAVLDDLPEMLVQAERLGIPVVLMSAPHNSWSKWLEGGSGRLWTAWHPKGAALETMMDLLRKWEANQ